MKIIPRELRSLWKYAANIVSPASSSVTLTKPTIDWSSVNQRFLANLSKPKLFLKHGCSEDPSHYQPYTSTGHWGHDGTSRTINHKSKFEEGRRKGGVFDLMLKSVTTYRRFGLKDQNWFRQGRLICVYISYLLN